MVLNKQCIEYSGVTPPSLHIYACWRGIPQGDVIRLPANNIALASFNERF